MNSNLGDLLAGDDSPDATPLPLRMGAPSMNAAPVAKPPVQEQKLMIQLEENDNIPPTGQFFGINGRSFILRAGVPALVPMSLVNILDDAVMSVPNVDPITMQVNGYRDKQRFPYRVVKQAA